jgi:hypothetical protein
LAAAFAARWAGFFASAFSAAEPAADNETAVTPITIHRVIIRAFIHGVPFGPVD